LLLMTGVVKAVLLFGEVLTAAAGSDDHADAAELIPRHRTSIQTRVLQRLGHAGRRQGNGARDMRPVLHLHVPLLVELGRDFPGYLHLVPCGIEARDPAHAADSVARCFPEPFSPNTVGADGPDPCDHCPLHNGQYRPIPYIPATQDSRCAENYCYEIE